METNETLKNLSILLGALKSDHLGKADFEEAFIKVIDHIKKIEQKNIQEIEQMHGMLTDLSEKVKNSVSSDFNSLKGEIGIIVDSHLKTLNSAHESKLKEVDDRMGEVRNGLDADEEIIVDKVCKLIKIPTIDELKNEMPVMGTQVRDALELLQGDERLDYTAIKGLKKLIEKLTKEYSSKNKAVGGLRPANTGIETPVGTKNGVNKAFTVAWIPEYITRNGQSVYADNGYTLSSASGVLTITLEYAPESDEILRSHYKEA